ncbi:hypothetical protein ACLMJK_006026 [Lecanora helva]
MSQVVAVNRKTKAALINHVLRVYALPEANEPLFVAKEFEKYFYDHSTSRFVLATSPKLEVNKEYFKEFMGAAKTRFDDLIAATKYKYTWDATKIEKDHVLEVQHVIKMLVDAGHLDDTKWSTVTLTSIFHLGFYLNDQRNLWNIPSALNQIKKLIPLSCWYRKQTATLKKSEAVVKAFRDYVKEYLFAYCTRGGKTPFSELLDLSAEMSGLPDTPLTRLTKAAGTELFNLLAGWSKYTGVSEYLAQKTSNVSNPEKNIADLYGNEKDSLLKKRKALTEQAEKGETLFASDVDKVGHATFDTVTKKYKISAEDSFKKAIQDTASIEEDASYFDDDWWSE